MKWPDLLISMYAAVYVLVAIGGVRMDLREGAPRSIIGLDVVVAVFALFGYAAYHSGYRAELLTGVWKLVAPLLVLAEAASVVRDLRSLKPEHDLSDRENWWVHTLGAWLAILFLVPIHWFNLNLAYGW
jgi:hypothetical protein